MKNMTLQAFLPFCSFFSLIKIKIHTHNLQVPFTNYLPNTFLQKFSLKPVFLKCLNYPTSPQSDFIENALLHSAILKY